MRIVAALGGNALLRRGEHPDADLQRRHVAEAARSLAPLATTHELVVCHGNGPQVGLLAVESENDRALSRPYPLDALGAETQGLIGYWLANLDSGSAQTPVPSTTVTQTTTAEPTTVERREPETTTRERTTTTRERPTTTEQPHPTRPSTT